jgi:hypothetical protein
MSVGHVFRAPPGVALFEVLDFHPTRAAKFLFAMIFANRVMPRSCACHWPSDLGTELTGRNSTSLSL